MYIRCVLHHHVVDAAYWLRARSAMTCAFDSEEELLAYFRDDYGAALEMMRGLQRDTDDAEDTRH